MKRVGIKISGICKILNLSEKDVVSTLNEIEKTPFRKFYDVKDGYYFGHIIEAINYYKILKNHK